MPFPLIPILTSIITPLATRVIKAYIEPKILPITEKVKEIEQDKPYLTNSGKHNELIAFIDHNKTVKSFIKKCGWSGVDMGIIVRFCVLMTKKPPTNRNSFNSWNDDDIKIITNFIRILAFKWIKAFQGKR